jgi:hypothetical protein
MTAVLRRLHRWISIVAAAFLLNMAITGMLVAWDEIRVPYVNRALFAKAKPSDMAGAPLPDALPALMDTTFTAAERETAGAPLAWLQLRVIGGVAQGLAVPTGAAGEEPLLFDAQSGERLSNPLGTNQQFQGVRPDGSGSGRHQLLKRLHRGDVIGSFYGRYIDIAAGLCLVYLLMSSCFMYWELLRRRWRSGRKALFWK